MGWPCPDCGGAIGHKCPALLDGGVGAEPVFSANGVGSTPTGSTPPGPLALRRPSAGQRSSSPTRADPRRIDLRELIGRESRCDAAVILPAARASRHHSTAPYANVTLVRAAVARPQWLGVAPRSPGERTLRRETTSARPRRGGSDDQMLRPQPGPIVDALLLGRLGR